MLEDDDEQPGLSVPDSALDEDEDDDDDDSDGDLCRRRAPSAAGPSAVSRAGGSAVGPGAGGGGDAEDARRLAAAAPVPPGPAETGEQGQHVRPQLPAVGQPCGHAERRGRPRGPGGEARHAVEEPLVQPGHPGTS